MNRIFNALLVLAFAGTMTLAATAQTDTSSAADQSNSNMSSKKSAGTAMADTHFVKKAAEGGLAEVELGQLAVQKASSEQVKKFGQRMVDDHSKANDELKEVASKEHITLPTEPDAKDRATKARLEKLSGAEFDKAYMADMVKDHRHDVAEFARESKNAQNPSVKSFAEKTLPTLREHLKMAEQIAPAQKTQAKNMSGSGQ
jgi:putative membrane protein